MNHQPKVNFGKATEAERTANMAEAIAAELTDMIEGHVEKRTLAVSVPVPLILQAIIALGAKQ